MAKEILENTKRKKVESIDTAQLEYTATTMFTYGTVVIAVIGIYAATIYLFAKQLRKD